MRVEFVAAVTDLMRKDSKAIFMTGDLGYKSFEELLATYGPQLQGSSNLKKEATRFINAGVAEQNMVGVAAGLALEGFRPWVYSIAPFLTYRCVEQIRNDICLHNLPVRIVGNGGGYTYGIMGSTHHTLEDMATLKALPNLTIYAPTTNDHVFQCVQQSAKLSGPSYLRLGFSGFGSVRKPIEENPVTLTRRFSTGNQAVIIGVGQGTQIALNAIDEKLIDPDQVSVFGISKFPFDLESDHELLKTCLQSQKVIVVEEHYIPGSLAESLKVALPAIEKFQILAPVYQKSHSYGSAKFHLTQTGVTPKALADMVSCL